MLTFDQIKPYLQYPDVNSIPAAYKHEFYNESITYKTELAEIFAKKWPDYLNEVRPRERKSDKEYRTKVYKNKWGHLVDRVSETFDYIHQADDFAITFQPDPEGIDPLLNLATYTGTTLTPDGDLKDWFFNYAIDAYLRDPNSCVAMVLCDTPNDAEFSEKGLFNPKPVLFPSEFVIAHQKGRFCVLKSPEKREYLDASGAKKEGEILHFFDDESYAVAFQVGTIVNDNKEEYSWQLVGLKKDIFINGEGETVEQTTFTPMMHDFNFMPVSKLGKRKIKNNHKREELYKSILDGALPSIKEAQQIQSDVEMERTFHVNSTEWRRQSALPKCANPQCVKGEVADRKTNGAVTMVMCPTCKGTGLNPSSGSSLEILIVNDGVDPQAMGSKMEAKKAEPGAPGGYIQKDIEPMIELSKELERIKDEVFSMINMRFINDIPTDASGTAKRMDREELYRELNTQAAHVIAILIGLYQQTDNSRYANFPYRGKQTPEIPVPVRFNLENAELTREELNDAKIKEYDPAIIQVLEAKFLEYNVGKSSLEYKQYITRVALDPFRNMNTDEKNMFLNIAYTVQKDGDARNRAIERILFSAFLDSLMIDAQLERDDFYTLPVKEQNEILKNLFSTYYDGAREATLSIDPATGLAVMNQFAVKPSVNIQDTNQTNETSKQKSSFGN